MAPLVSQVFSRLSSDTNLGYKLFHCEQTESKNDKTLLPKYIWQQEPMRQQMQKLHFLNYSSAP